MSPWASEVRHFYEHRSRSCAHADEQSARVAPRLTDHPITQLPWWSEQLTVLPRPKRGGGSRRPVRTAARVVWRSREFDAFVSANVRNALAIGLFKRLTGRRRPLLVMTEMRLDDTQDTFYWRTNPLQRFAYAAVDAMCLSSRREAQSMPRDWLSLPKNSGSCRGIRTF